jgi:putative lipoic acid-binding regulatory protein
LFRPEYIGLNNKVIINTDRFKAFGVIKQLMPDKIDQSFDTNEKGVLEKRLSMRKSSSVSKKLKDSSKGNFAKILMKQMGADSDSSENIEETILKHLAKNKEMSKFENE